MENFRSDMSTYVKRWTRMRPRKYKWCRDMLSSENLHVVPCHGWYNFAETRRIWWTNWKLCSKLHIHVLCVKIYIQSRLFSQWKRLIVRSRLSKTMGNFHSDTSSCMSKVAHGHFINQKLLCRYVECKITKGSNILHLQMALLWSSSWTSIVVSRSSWSIFLDSVFRVHIRNYVIS